MSAPNSREAADYLRHIATFITQARSFVVGIDFDAFIADTRTNYAVVRALEMIGEATKQVPADIRARAPSVPWRDMAAMRDKLIHGYADVDLEVVWKTVSDDLPELEPRILRVIAELTEADGVT